MPKRNDIHKVLVIGSGPIVIGQAAEFDYAGTQACLALKEEGYEVIRDANDTAITVCNMENLDPVGIHTGDSVVVAPSQTLTNKEYQMLRDSALRIIRALKVEGGCNVQFALDPYSFSYYVIEVNPRVSRSSALASKASGYPIARVSAKIAIGMQLHEIKLANTPACFEPTLDYVVTKMPRFPFDKFPTALNTLSTQMKATGEVMSVGRSFEESFLKAIRSLEDGRNHIHLEKFDSAHMTVEQLLDYIKEGTDDRLYAISQLMWMGVDASLICDITQIDMFFVDKIKKIVDLEKELEASPGSVELLREAKRSGFSDSYVAELWGDTTDNIYKLRCEENIFPVYKMIDTCASEFDSYVPYFYSTYAEENESIVSDKPKIIVLGSGPIRIGQGVEFDYSTVHAVRTIKQLGYEAIVINNNPETVSTDYTAADKLYFEPLTPEDVMNVVHLEKPLGVIATLGGQTAVNLAQPLADRGVRIIGTGCEAIDKAEDRDLFNEVIHSLGIPNPVGEAVTDIESGVAAAERIGYPVLVRPSFVLGGRAMEIVANEEMLRKYLKNAVEVDEDKPVLIDKYLMGKEVEVDAVCDGREVFVPGIMELVERTGVHSGDSTSVYPPFSISQKVRDIIADYTTRLGLGIGIVGLFNIQFIVDKNDDVFVIEVNPRASRSVPFLSKSTGCGLVGIATKAMLGVSLREQGITEMRLPDRKRWYVKAPAFSFAKLTGMDAYLSPEMKSTGEAIGYDKRLNRALYKALQAAGIPMLNYGTVLVTVADEDKEETLPLVKRFRDIGFNIEATTCTADFLRSHGIRVKKLANIHEGSEETLDSIRSGHVSYIINTRAILSGIHYESGEKLRRCAVDNGVTTFTSLDTVRIVLDVLEELINKVSTIDEDQ